MPRRYDYRHTYVATVEEALARFTVDQLKALVRLLPNAGKPSRKAELITEIERHLAGDLLRKLWARLDETQQLAVREALHGSAGEFSPQQFPRQVRLPARRRRDTPVRRRRDVAAEPVPLRSRRLPQHQRRHSRRSGASPA